MKVSTSLAARVSALGLCLILTGASVSAAQQPPPPQGAKPAQPQAPPAEMQAAQAVQAAADAQAALTAAGEFVKKYPKSTIRLDVARVVADKIGEVVDPVQQITLVESYRKVFNEPAEGHIIQPHLIQAYVEAKRLDEAFAAASPAAVAEFDNPVATMISLTIIGAEQAQRQNPKFVQQSQQFGLKAVELIEANRKPEALDDATWAEYKTKWLPQVYHSLGLIAYVNRDAADAKAKLAKATELGSVNPFTYVLVGIIANNEYQQLAQQHKSAAAGAAKDELLKRAHAQMDQIIDAYAHAIALTEGNTAYDQLRTQLRQDLEAYYKYRNNGSTEGLQKLIDKYKKPTEFKLN